MNTHFAEPARRCFQDAETLFRSGRLGTPDHLYGLAAECALKAILVGLKVICDLSPERRYKVHIDKLWGEYLLAVSSRGRSARSLSLDSYNPFISWLSEHRYWDDGAFDADRVSKHREGARKAIALLECARLNGVVL